MSSRDKGLAHLPDPDPVVPLGRLDDALRQVGLDSRRVVDAISGPLIDRPRQRAADRHAVASCGSGSPPTRWSPPNRRRPPGSRRSAPTA